MTLGLEPSNTNSKGSSRNMVQILTQIVDILEKYEGQYEKKLNFTELLKRLHIPPAECDEIISFIFRFQSIFKGIFRDYKLKQQKIGNKVYLLTERSFREDIFYEFDISQSHVKFLNDIIYTFKFVKRGKGFESSQNTSELISNLKKIKAAHPYLFESHGNGAIYPSKLGLKLGELIISYNKSNKNINTIEFDNFIFHIRSDE
jgi:hypothetical protein